MQVHSNPVLSSQSPYSVQSEPSVLLVRPNTSSSVSFVVTVNDSNAGGPPSEALQGTLTALDLDRSGVSLAYNSSGRGQLAFYLFFLVYVACQHSLPSLLLLANHLLLHTTSSSHITCSSRISLFSLHSHLLVATFTCHLHAIPSNSPSPLMYVRICPNLSIIHQTSHSTFNLFSSSSPFLLTPLTLSFSLLQPFPSHSSSPFLLTPPALSFSLLQPFPSHSSSPFLLTPPIHSPPLLFPSPSLPLLPSPSSPLPLIPSPSSPPLPSPPPHSTPPLFSLPGVPTHGQPHHGGLPPRTSTAKGRLSNTIRHCQNDMPV